MIEITTNELKPCPFCGGKAEYVRKPSFFDDRASIAVRCTECYAQTERWSASVDYSSKDKVTEIWNRRSHE